MKTICLKVSADLVFPVLRRELPWLVDNWDALANADTFGMTWVGVEEIEPTRVVKSRCRGWQHIIPGKYHATCFGGYRCGRGGCFYRELPGETGKMEGLGGAVPRKEELT